MHTKFFTGQSQNTLFNKLSGVFEHNPQLKYFDVLVGYFRASGYFKLRLLLENIDHIRILVGIDVDTLTQHSHALGLVYQQHKTDVHQAWQDQFIADIEQANYDRATERGIKQFVRDMQTGKVTIKAHPSQKIHAKLYIFRPDNFNPHSASSVITGSSNLTDAGLGIRQANYEFNVLLNDYADVKFASDEFERLWAEGVEILPEVVSDGLARTYLADDVSPYELYLKCLIEYFGSEIEFDPNSIKDLPKGFKRLSYQMDAVNEGWEMLKKHNGFFLADVVGLGKTVIAVLIARQFWINSQKDCSILVITPPAIKSNWQSTFDTFNFNANIEIITNGSLDKAQDKQYDLVMIDEAHKFRNNATGGYDLLQKICKKTRINQHNEVIVTQSKVILISATPLNNKPNDIFNQVLLFQDKNQTTLDFALGSFFSKINTKYKKIKIKQENAKEIKALYQQVREKLIQPLMVRRTRTDLIANKRYQKDLEQQKIVFPTINQLTPLYYQLAPQLNILFDNTLAQISPSEAAEKQGKGLRYTRYQAIHFLTPELKKNYSSADNMAKGLAGIMKTLLLKRMDSSFYAFKKTLNSFLASSNAMLKMIENDAIIISKDKKILEYILDENIQDIEKLADKTEGKDYIKCTIKDFEAGFKVGIEHDNKILNNLVNDWDKVTEDPKIDEFNQQLSGLLVAHKNPEQKLVIFTESADTMAYLSKHIDKNYKTKVLSVSGENRDKLKNTIQENFDANIPGKNKKNEYQIIITTDVLAEGVNLHRANTILNYDTPWNATKLMQRIGRVNRIGSVADNIYIYNFFPTKQVEDNAGLAQNAKTKMQGFHSALGEDSQIYSDEEQVGTFGIFDQTIQNDKDERLVFLEKIKQFKKDHEQEFQRIKKLSSKQRNAVKNTQHKNSTLSFIRTADKNSARFYLTHDQQIQEWTFIQSAKLLECKKEDKAEKKLPKFHYQQVTQSIETFTNEQETTIVQKKQDAELSKKESSAIGFLKALSNINELKDEQKSQLTIGIKLIEIGVFSQLHKNINNIYSQLKKSKITTNESLKESLTIIEPYIQTETADNSAIVKTNNKQPSVVISQSYV